ncbi:molecular co-chaperone STI1 [Ostreococcus tauri]|uniref:Molecular co-chaperone STI1 n=1 Tax=Ostreococcus tauri TaxID=70448 RepID=A0A1Y5I9R0_OSTTA|nr:molecular co-chaperone STI1 [Ostreococcus tauri]
MVTTTDERQRYRVRADTEGARAAMKSLGVDVSALDEDAVARAVDLAKRRGNEAFGRREYARAIEAYTTAIAGCDWDRTLYANRSAAALAIGLVEDALRDAATCVKIDEMWAKGWYRLGCALMAAFESVKAHGAFAKGLELAPESVDMRDRLEEARAAAEDELERIALETLAVRRDLAYKLREARAQDRRTEIENQWKQTMNGPDWDIEDYEWRPTFLPQMCLRKIDASRFQEDPGRLNVINYAMSLADLAAPKRSLKILDDTIRMAAYNDAIELTVGDTETLNSTLVISAGGGVLPLIAARAGSKKVFAIERNRYLYRMAKQILKSNADKFAKDTIGLLDQKLQACSLAKADDDSSVRGPQLLTQPSELIVTDLFDHGAFGLGLLRAVDHVGEKKLATPDARIIPSRVRVKAQLIALRLDRVSGFDLTALNAYRWHPQASKQDLYSEPHVVLSDPFDVSDIDIQARLQKALSAEQCSDGMEQDDVVYVTAIKDGSWNAIAYWFECELCDGVELKSYDVSGDRSAAMSSLGAAVQYLDEITVTRNQSIELRIQRDVDRVYFSSTPPSTRPRHANIASWHYDMLNDASRNNAYEAAIKRAIAHRKKQNLRNEVLDVGAGSGLLSMFAMRAGADRVYAAEMSNHMCDAGEETVCMNGYGTSIMFLNRDARRLFTKESEGLIKHGLKPDGVMPEMDRKSDILVYEVFDSGLIGEGALHIVGMAKHRLLASNATIIPSSATVYAQPIQLRIDHVSGFDCSQANRWRWRSDYEGINLELCRDKWKPLAPWKEVFDFDFNNYMENLQPTQRALEFDIDDEGVFNAVAFWFKLQLDEETELTTSPHVGAQKGQTWQQAVQYIEELRVDVGDKMPLVASHDTYGIKFEVNDTELQNRVAKRTGVPAYDPHWHVMHERIAEASHAMAKAVTQNPMVYREAAETAVALGSRPQDFGLSAEDGGEYCLKLMG